MSTKRIVVDASVALKWRLKDEEATTQADALLDDFRRQETSQCCWECAPLGAMDRRLYSRCCPGLYTVKPSIPFEKHHLEFLSDPDRARAYLEVALEEYARDQNTSALLLALKDIAAAHS